MRPKESNLEKRLKEFIFAAVQTLPRFRLSNMGIVRPVMARSRSTAGPRQHTNTQTFPEYNWSNWSVND